MFPKFLIIIVLIPFYFSHVGIFSISECMGGVHSKPLKDSIKYTMCNSSPAGRNFGEEFFGDDDYAKPKQCFIIEHSGEFLEPLDKNSPGKDSFEGNINLTSSFLHSLDLVDTPTMEKFKHNGKTLLRN